MSEDKYKVSTVKISNKNDWPQLLRKNNCVSLFGKIISEPKVNYEVFGEKFYEFSIEVNRLSKGSDIIPVVLSERLLNSYNEIEGGVTVQIKGQYSTYNNGSYGKSKLVYRVFATEVEFVEEMTIAKTNEILIEGFVCKKPNYRITPFGREISDLLVAVNKGYNKSDYIPCIAWGRYAKCCSSFNVGDRIIVVGRIQSRNYEKNLRMGKSKKK